MLTLTPTQTLTLTLTLTAVGDESHNMVLKADGTVLAAGKNHSANPSPNTN